MPYYSFQCPEHGNFDVFQHMNETHRAQCPKCAKDAVRLFSSFALGGNLDSKDKRMGKTREELFQNLGKEGFADKDMWKWDKDDREKSLKG